MTITNKTVAKARRTGKAVVKVAEPTHKMVRCYCFAISPTTDHSYERRERLLLLSKTRISGILYGTSFVLVGGNRETTDVLFTATEVYNSYDSGYGAVISECYTPHDDTNIHYDAFKFFTRYGILPSNADNTMLDEVLDTFAKPNDCTPSQKSVDYSKHYVAWSIKDKQWLTMKPTRRTTKNDDALQLPELIKAELCAARAASGSPIKCETCSIPITDPTNLHIHSQDQKRYCKNCY